MDNIESYAMGDLMMAALTWTVCIVTGVLAVALLFHA